jgi:serine protease Do
MQPSRRYCLYASLALLAFCVTAQRTFAETLTITSSPPGATVEINGVVVGVTPYIAKFPGGYFHKTHTVFGTRLEHGMLARVYKDGYSVQEIELTDGPFEWVALNGRNHGRYWLFKTDQIKVSLDAASAVFRGTVSTSALGGSRVDLRPEIPVETVVERAAPAVVLLDGTTKQGSGFFVTDTGVIATNAHVARGESSLIVECQGRGKILGKVVYVDNRFDLALVKVDGNNFPYLPLAAVSQIRPGQTVIAIGNPAMGMPDTVTKGIVSAVGPDKEAGSGTWIQTDAAINPGNSGGPLLNTRGEVVGLNTQKALVTQGSDHTPLQGIGFALSAEDLIRVLRRFYPEASVASPGGGSSDLGIGSVAIASDPAGAEIYIDGKFVGQTPSTIRLPSGAHRIEVKSQGKQNWQRDLEVLKDSELTLHPVLAEVQP